MDNILTSIKGQLGITEEQTYYDDQLIPLINTQFMYLKRMGAGPEEGYRITSEDNVWSEFTSNPAVASAAETYIYAKVKQIFDPSSSATVTQALKEVAAEAEFTLQLECDKLKNDGGE